VSFVTYVRDRAHMIAAFASATILIGASVVGYDFLGHRNVPIDEQPSWVTPPVWSELYFGAIALGLGVYLFRKQHSK